MRHKAFPYERLIFFATGNIHKFNEARRVLAENNINVAMLKMKALEIQDDELESIAKTGALQIALESQLSIIVDDSGLFIDSLNGFPGVYSEHVFRTIGKEGILKLLEGCRNRRAFFRSVVAFCNAKGVMKCFKGVVEGNVTNEIRGLSGFGFDPIFEPLENSKKTFGEMTEEEKNRVSHRARALRQFAEWYRSKS